MSSQCVVIQNRNSETRYGHFPNRVAPLDGILITMRVTQRPVYSQLRYSKLTIFFQDLGICVNGTGFGEKDFIILFYTNIRIQRSYPSELS